MLGNAPDVIALVEGAAKYPEGRGIRLAIRAVKDIDVVESLVRIKMAN